MIEIKEYLYKLLKGEISLFKSFWIWFIALSFLIEMFFQIRFNQNPSMNKSYIEFLLFLFSLIYAILIFTIIYKSANNYKGSKIWVFLAKTIITINLFFSITFSIDVVKFYFFEDYSINKEIENFKSSLPIRVDSSSTLIDINKENKTIFYTYQLFNVALLKPTDISKFKSKVQDSLCEDESSLDLLKKDYILDYVLNFRT
ncbi:MAG: hypothetical protein KA055_04090 [Aliarcobacter sp.]|nr:hypothetical protein [Aliarcobacter sp.]